MLLSFLSRSRILFVLISVTFSSLIAGETDQLLDWQQITTLFRTQYAPLEWKKQHFGWDLQTAIVEAENRLYASGTPTLATYQKTVLQFLSSLHDYHVGAHFASTEQASLPFTVKGIDGKYWISWIDRDHLPEDSYPFQTGDELTFFDGRPTQECIDEILEEAYSGGGALTEQLLAERILTCREAERGLQVPQGPITIKVVSAKTEKPAEYEMVWDYQENIFPILPFVKSPHKKSFSLFNASMLMEHYPTSQLEKKSRYISSNPMLLGERNSFFPPLAAPEMYEGNTPNFPFYAYTFTHPQTGKRIGFVRIPHYVANEEEVQAFGELMEYFEASTSALVIDQQNNPGGKVYYVYALASLLSPEPLKTPRHQFNLTYDGVMETFVDYQMLKSIRSNDATKEIFKELGHETANGYPINYQMVVMLRHYCLKLLESWKRGERLTPPLHVAGVNKVLAHPQYTPYSKPILMLTNGLDFSGGDFLPAILQDSQLNGMPRAVIFGERTAGAGGIVKEYKFPNDYGLIVLTHTVSIACRENKSTLEPTYLENLGVTPDIAYKVTPGDLRNEWQGYRQAVLDALVPMVDAETSEEPIVPIEGEIFQAEPSSLE